jgi:lipoate-protein ligase B
MPCGLDNRKVTSVFNESNVRVKDIEKKLESIFLKNIKKI